MKYAEIEKRVVRTPEGKIFIYADKEAKIIISLAWMVQRFLGLPVTHALVDDIRKGGGGVLIFEEPAKPRILTSEQTAAISGFWRYCKEITAGVERNNPVWLPALVEAPVHNPRLSTVLIFTDQGRAEMCRNMLWNVFGLESKIDEGCTGWRIRLQSGENDNRTITARDMYRIEGACTLLARHTITPAQSAVQEVAREMPVPNAPPAAHGALRNIGRRGEVVSEPQSEARPAWQVVRSRRRSA